MEILILLGVMATMDDQFYIKIYVVILSLRVKQNSFILFFELEVAKCFYVSRSLFPDFGYSKLKCVFANAHKCACLAPCCFHFTDRSCLN